MAKATKKKKALLKTVDKNSELPASHGQLEAVRSELKSDIASLKLVMKSQFKTVDAKFDKLSSEIKGIAATVNRGLAISEEQNFRNKYLFDGFKAVLDGQKHLEVRVLKIEKTSFGSNDL